MKQLKNITEAFVEQYLDEHLPKTDVCQCADCRMDIMALMLNRLPTRYVATETGELFARLQQSNLQHTVDITLAMAEAVDIVKRAPKHR